eukprot:1738815-Rhodomonas_salina.1
MRRSVFFAHRCLQHASSLKSIAPPPEIKTDMAGVLVFGFKRAARFSRGLEERGGPFRVLEQAGAAQEREGEGEGRRKGEGREGERERGGGRHASAPRSAESEDGTELGRHVSTAL